ncbi:MAG: hypothetical protein J6B01_06160 [Ruminococcus sp.]|nr:hypothetical protein [Ruminococcus sp.]
MTRKEFLRSMLKSIFTVVTLSIEDGMINKGSKNSFYHNCNYTVGSYNDFKRLFEIAFISNPTEDEDKEDLNRQDTMDRAKKYLSDYGILIPNYLTDKEKRELIYAIFVRYLLRVIIIDYENKNKNDSADDNITDDFLSAIRLIQYELGLRYNKPSVELTINNYKGYTQVTDNEFATEPDKCNLSIACDMCYMEEYQVLEYLRKIQLGIPSEYNKEDYSTYVGKPYEIPTLIISGFFHKEHPMKMPNYYPAYVFQDRNDLFVKTHYIFKTYTEEADIIKDTKKSSIGRTIAGYSKDLVNKIETQLKLVVNAELKPFYENNRTYLESMINGIANFNKKAKDLLEEYKNTGDDKVVKGILFDRCSQLFWNFEMPYLAIEQAYHDDVNRGMYIIIQNFILDLTEILISHGEEIAEQFKNNLSAKSYKEHKAYIKRYTDPVKKHFDMAIEFESVFAKNHQEYAKEPEAIEDFFHCIRTGTYSSFRSALYEYYLKLQDAQKKK